jgi:hypothetical protein
MDNNVAMPKETFSVLSPFDEVGLNIPTNATKQMIIVGKIKLNI